MTRWERILEDAADHDSWLIPRLHSFQTVQVYAGDWLVEDFVLSCEERIKRRFAELGIHFEIPEGLPELHNPARRLRSIW
jgi:hypothetical protein